MVESDRCPGCGAAVPANAPRGHCPACLLKLGLASVAQERSLAGSSRAARKPAGSGVLGTLAASLGSVPRVLLRDVDEGGTDEDLVRPLSTEVPSPAVLPSRLRLLGEIARGGMGAILKGRDEDLGRDLAVKVLLESHRDHPELVRRFVEEAQICGQLQHPGIVPIYELGTFDDRRPFFSMKLVKGKTLAEMLHEREHPKADQARLLGIFEQVCQTMAYAHARGVIHRDLKPSNVMVGSFGEVQVMDWGLAKVLPRGGVVDDNSAGKVLPESDAIFTVRSGSDVDHSVAGSVLGTPSYMAPEQARGEIARVDGRADVFALGAILCEILTGQPAFIGRTSGEILIKAAHADLADARGRLNACEADAELIALTRRCLAPAVEDRPRHAALVVESLRAYFEGAQAKLRAAEQEVVVCAARAVEERKRKRLVIALAASVFALVGLAAGGYAWTEWQKSIRRLETVRLVDEALEKATNLRGEAEANETVALARLDAALSEVKRAEDVGHQGVADAGLILRIARSRESLAKLRRDAEERARRLAAYRATKTALDNLRLQWTDSGIGRRTPYSPELSPAEIFRAAGIDPADPGAGDVIRGSPLREDLVVGLDLWARGFEAASPERARLLTLVDATDDSAWRREFRNAIRRDDNAKLKKLAAEVDALAQPPSAIAWAGETLLTRGLPEEAVSVLRRAQRHYPADFWINYELGRSLSRTQNPMEAKGYLRAAIARRPTLAAPRFHVALLERRTGDLEAGVRTLEELDALSPNAFWVMYNLSVFESMAGDIESALFNIRRALAHSPDSEWAHSTLSHYLMRQGKLDEALAESHQALALRANCELAHVQLAEVLRCQRKLEQATTALRLAIQYYPEDGTNHFELADVLRQQGKHEEALKEYREGYAKGAARPDDPVRECEQAIRMLPRLAGIVAGTDRPRDTGETAIVAQLCLDRRLFVSAVRFWDMVFKAEPALAADRQRLSRFYAACAAASAGCGESGDEASPDAATMAALRHQALFWLREELAAWSETLKKLPLSECELPFKYLDRWRREPGLVGVRDRSLIAGLPAAEQMDWLVLWADFERVRASKKFKR